MRDSLCLCLKSFDRADVKLIASLLDDMVAMSEKRLDEADYDVRLSAFSKLRDALEAAEGDTMKDIVVDGTIVGNDALLPVLHQSVGFTGSLDSSTRGTAGCVQLTKSLFRWKMSCRQEGFFFESLN